jgi:hypothetical protein
MPLQREVNHCRCLTVLFFNAAAGRLNVSSEVSGSLFLIKQRRLIPVHVYHSHLPYFPATPSFTRWVVRNVPSRSDIFIHPAFFPLLIFYVLHREFVLKKYGSPLSRQAEERHGCSVIRNPSWTWTTRTMVSFITSSFCDMIFEIRKTSVRQFHIFNYAIFSGKIRYVCKFDFEKFILR